MIFGAVTTNATERGWEIRKRDNCAKQLNESRPYYKVLYFVALKRIEMDLGDRVKKNYQLYYDVEISIEGKKKQTIDLTAKL